MLKHNKCVIFDKRPLSYIYFNLHKKQFSIRKKGIVVAHVNKLFVKNVSFKVNESGRQRVLKENRKNVHAFIVGEICSGFIEKGIEITYNPYLFENFVTQIEHIPVRSAQSVFLSVVSGKAKIIACNIE